MVAVPAVLVVVEDISAGSPDGASLLSCWTALALARHAGAAVWTLQSAMYPSKPKPTLGTYEVPARSAVPGVVLEVLALVVSLRLIRTRGLALLLADALAVPAVAHVGTLLSAHIPQLQGQPN